MVEEAPEKVKLVVVSKFQTFKVPVVRVMAAAPSVSDLVPLPDQLIDPADIVWPLKSTVPVCAPPVIERTVCEAVIVTVPAPEEASKVTSSEDPGTDCPPAPPEEAAQLVVVAASQLPVPPTQKRAAIG
jgi:hypothetical protein